MSADVVRITVDAENVLGEMPHRWNYIGYDEINYTYTPEGQELLAKFGLMQEQPYYVRAHHILCTGNAHAAYKWGSTNVYSEDDGGNPKYDFGIVDLILDTILQHGLKPFVELGFMPQDLVDARYYDLNSETRRMTEYRAFGYACPPKDYQKWYDLIFSLVRHAMARYGEAEVLTWYWELWNEPDGMYWRGSIAEFNKLYDYTAAAVKAAHPQARIGGPATTGPGRGKNAAHFLESFLEHCVNEVNAVTGQVGAPLDYVSFHIKGSNFRSGPLQKVAEPPSTQWLFKQLQLGYQIISRYPGLNRLECVLSEADPDGWAAGGNGDHPIHNFRNTEYYATYTASIFDKILHFGLEKNWDVRPLTWAFMFVGERCFEGTRVFSTQGIDKAIFNLLRMVTQLGERRVSMLSSGAQDVLAYADGWGSASGPDVSGFATLTAEDSLRILVYSHHDLIERSGETEIELDIAHLPARNRPLTLRHYRIDGAHSNAYAEWVRQGQPDYPTGGQYAAIKARDGLELLDAPRVVAVSADHQARISFKMPVHSISLLVLE